MELVLCRHSETDYNKEKRYQGRTDNPLNGNGIAQAKLIGEKLSAEKFYAAFTSPLRRCTQTAEQILSFQKGLNSTSLEALIELDYGLFSGLTPKEITQKFPGEWEKKVENPYEFVHPNGESYKGVDERRVRPLLAEFREKYASRKILVVTHQGTGRLIIGSMLGLSPKEKMEISIPNDCIYSIEYRPHKTAVKYFLAETGAEGSGYLERNLSEQFV
ncbi:MAG: histidine phosphatase family protein [archaeon]